MLTVTRKMHSLHSGKKWIIEDNSLLPKEQFLEYFQVFTHKGPPRAMVLRVGIRDLQACMKHRHRVHEGSKSQFTIIEFF